MKCTFIDESNLIQGTPEWHLFRAKGFGASEVNIIAGQNIWETVVDLWEFKTGKKTKEFKMNDAIQHGINTEPEARERFTLATGIEMNPICAISNDLEFCRASLDGINESRDILLEIKCPSKLAIHMKTVRGTIPSYYYPQIQHQLFVTGAELACFWSYVQSMGGFMLEFKPDTAYIEELIKREERLWECVQKDIPPTISDFPPMNPSVS